MRRALKRVGIGIGGLVALLLVVAAVLYAVGSSRVTRTYEVQTTQLAIPTDATEIQRGAHLANIHGCTECHGPQLGGAVFAEAPPFRVVASNLTRGKGGVGGLYTPATWDRAIRHGVKHDGRSLLIMPSAAFHNLTDADAAAVIAYVMQVPPVDSELPPTEVRPLGRLLSAFALDPTMEVNTEPARATAPPAQPTREYGAYLTSVTCAYCHGPGLRGAQPPNPDSRPAPDLAPAGQWSLDQFAHALRTGVTPGGRQLDPTMMPWPITAHMTDVELEAIHAHLATLVGGTRTATAQPSE